MSNLEASRILASALKDVDEILKVNQYETDDYDAEISNDNRDILPKVSIQNTKGKSHNETLNDSRNVFDEAYLYRAGKDFSVLINRLQICINKLNQSKPAPSIHASEYQALNFGITENSSFDIAHRVTTQPTKFNLNLSEQSKQMQSQYVFPPDEFSTCLNDKRFHQRITKLRGQIQAQANRIAELEKDGNPLSYLVNKNCTTDHRNKNISQLPTDVDNLQLLNEVSKQHLRINALEETNRDLEEKINKLEKELSQRPGLFNLRNSYEDLQSLKYNRQCATIHPTVSNRSATLSNNMSTLNESSRESNRLNYQTLFRRSITPVTFNNSCSFITTSNQPEYNLNFIHQSLTGTQSTPPTSRLIYDKPYRYDAYIPCEQINHNKLSSPGENYAYLSADQFKSASLNELCYSRVTQPVTTTTNISTTTSSNNIVNPNASRRWLAQNRYSMKSPPADIFNGGIQDSDRINLLPPQYGSSYHQHIYNNSRTRSPTQLQWYQYTRSNFNDGRQTSADCELNGSVNLFNSSRECDSPSSGRCTTVHDTHLYTSRNKSNLSNASSSSPSEQQHNIETINNSTNILKDEKSSSLPKSTLNGKNQSKRLNIERANFTTWDKNMISAWLYKIGLGYTVSHTRRWLTSGQDLINESKKSLAQLMCIRNPLHLKKLLIHIRLCMKDQYPNNSNNININYNYGCLYRNIEPPENFDIPGWLHDVGLSSYIPQFDNCIIDPYVLDQLTMDDLSVLKMSSELHMLSLRWGLQMLRHINFDRNRLCRSQMEQCEANLPCKRNMLHSPIQSLNHIQDNIKPNNGHNGNHVHTSCLNTISTLQPDSMNSDINFICSTYLPIQICYWTQQRVMNWLQSIELPEYASELCGNGVHGALMILEDRFTPDLLADILRIPPVKSLVRRHLTNKFIELVGLDIWKRKQHNETTNNNNPLTIHSKIKLTKKKNIFNSNRGHKSNHHNHVSGVGDDDASTELVCPIEIDASHTSIFAEEIVKPNRQSIHLQAENVQTILIDPVTAKVQHLELQETDL
ncbi:unnamed protein product [Schistosoma curassoni]|nr:unnamed protein product [Schistosoma curassoni]